MIRGLTPDATRQVTRTGGRQFHGARAWLAVV